MNDFLPSIGTLTTYIRPVGQGIRVDDGFEEGMEVPIYYDPMISKLITYGASRHEAISLMKKAIQMYQIEGIETTLPFGTFVCNHEAFISGNFDTHFVHNFYSKERVEALQKNEAKLAAFVALKAYLEEQQQLKVPTSEI